jgi:hypothetical protein
VKPVAVEKTATAEEKLIAVLSNPESGVLTTYHDDPVERVGRYFEFMVRYPHK